MTKFNRNIEGILPPHLLVEIARRNPELTHYLKTLARTAEMWKGSEARNGQLYRFLNAGKSDRQVYDAQHHTRRPGVKARFEGEGASSDKVVNDVYDFGGTIRSFYMDVHGRNGIDANGMVMKFVTHYDQDYDNAFWDGEMMTFGDGDQDIFSTFVLLDVTGHELTHGITEFAAGTEYYGQSGALNEHFSDVWGELIEQYSLKQTADKGDWLVGRGLFMPNIKGRALRDMLNPGTAYNDPKLGKDPQPAHMSKYYKTSSDNGGVHYNSGIPNKAFATFAVAVGGFAWEKAGKIWYAARVAAGSKPSFAQFAAHTIEACKALFPDELTKLQKAWGDVGVTPSLTEVDTLTPPMFDESASA